MTVLRFGCLLLVISQCTLEAAEQKPNILFIAIDDLNDWVGCLGGHPQAKTPNIDALAARGVNFNNAHCQAPICNCSRVSMLLGKLPSTTGMYFLAPDFRNAERTKNEETVFQYFRRHGYYASTRGKVFHGKDEASFDHIEPSSGWRKDKKRLAKKWPKTNALWDWGQVDVPDSDQHDYLTAERAASELPKLAMQDKPFFLAIGFSLPHVPVYASQKWFDLHPLKNVQLPTTLDSDLNDLSEFSQLLTLNPTGPRHTWMKENDEWKPAVRAYLASTSFVDSQIGRILDSLTNSGVADNTIVVLWSDHGFHLGEKLRWAKRTLWEESTHVPLIMVGPGIQAGTCSRAVGLIDVFPTLAEHCGLPPKADLDGASLSPLLKDPGKEWHRPALTTFGPNNHAVRTDDWRYIRYSDGSEELYDHRSDPNEWTNLAAEPQHAGLISFMKRSLPVVNSDPLPGSRGADSPLYKESGKRSEE